MSVTVGTDPTGRGISVLRLVLLMQRRATGAAAPGCGRRAGRSRPRPRHTVRGRRARCRGQCGGKGQSAGREARSDEAAPRCEMRGRTSTCARKGARRRRLDGPPCLFVGCLTKDKKTRIAVSLEERILSALPSPVHPPPQPWCSLNARGSGALGDAVKSGQKEAKRIHPTVTVCSHFGERKLREEHAH